MYYNFDPYISVAEQAEKAAKEILKMRKRGFDPKPVVRFNGKIAKSFWVAKWCENLETYADMAYRAERGRRYVRAGSVCHLEIGSGKVEAYVSGNKLYHVEIGIDPIAPDNWQEICKKCAADMGSVVELLQGKLSKNVMELVCRQSCGLFPSPAQIDFRCSCPDGAAMCKHVAAVLYGIGRRLDENPQMLFTLRGVKPEDLAQIEFDAPKIGDELASGSLEEIFGIDLDMGEVSITSGPNPAIAPEAAKGQADAASAKDAAKPASGAPCAKKSPDDPPRPVYDPKAPTGEGIRALRKLAGLTQAEMAKKIGVSIVTISKWESSATPRPQSGSRYKLQRFQEKLLRKLARDKK